MQRLRDASWVPSFGTEGLIRVTLTQGLVLGFFALAWARLVVMIIAAPQLATRVLRLPDGSLPGEVVFLVALSVFLFVLGIGVFRRWRWTFWLPVVAFLAGLLRAPASILELIGVLPAGGPAWYLLFQTIVGLIQFSIALALLRGYRKAGVWGAF
jgi:hypothetical protein